jgi:hypothetical protein
MGEGMSGPWEQFAQSAGPWEKFSQTEQPSGLDAIEPAYVAPKKEEESLGDKVKGVGEAALATVTAPIGQVAGLGSALLHRAAGDVGPGKESFEDIYNRVSKANTYEPRTQSGKDYLGKVSDLLDESKLAGLAPEGPNIIRAAPAAGKLLKEEASIAREAIPKLPKKELSGEQLKKQGVLQESVKEGYVVPPKDAPTAGIASKTLGSWSGKVKTEQAASIRNQEVTNNLVKKELGLPEQHPITPESLNAIRDESGKAYKAITRRGTPFAADPEYFKAVRAIGGISNELAEKYPNIGKNPEIEKIREDLAVAEHDPEHAIELTKILRKQGNANRMAAERTADPKTKALADAQLRGAKAVEDLIERNLEKSGEKQLLENFRAARKKIAQTYDVERVLDPSGNVIAGKLAKRADRVTGELKKVADFATQFPKAAQNATRLGGEEDYSVLDIAGAAASVAATGGLDSFGATLAGRPLARRAALSGPVQRSLADYKP